MKSLKKLVNISGYCIINLEIIKVDQNKPVNNT